MTHFIPGHEHTKIRVCYFLAYDELLASIGSKFSELIPLDVI